MKLMLLIKFETLKKSRMRQSWVNVSNQIFIHTRENPYYLMQFLYTAVLSHFEQI